MSRCPESVGVFVVTPATLSRWRPELVADTPAARPPHAVRILADAPAGEIRRCRRDHRPYDPAVHDALHAFHQQAQNKVA
jgi:hypothetical protein